MVIRTAHSFRERVAKNRKKLQSIIETIILCGQENIYLSMVIVIMVHTGACVSLWGAMETFELSFSSVSHLETLF